MIIPNYCYYPSNVCRRCFQWMCMFIDRSSRHWIMDSFAQSVFGVEVTWIDGIMFCFYFAQAHERLRILGKVFATKGFTKSGRLRWTKLETYPQSPVAIDSRFAGYTTKNKGIYRCRLKLKSRSPEKSVWAVPILCESSWELSVIAFVEVAFNQIH